MITEDRAMPGAGETWRHYKGGLYHIVAIGKIEATFESAVIYHKHGEPFGIWWIRPEAEFMGTVEITEDGHSGHVFRFVREG